MKKFAALILIVCLAACSTPPKVITPDGSNRVPVNKNINQ